VDFALPVGAARSPAGTLADPTAREMLTNVRDISRLRGQPRKQPDDVKVAPGCKCLYLEGESIRPEAT
jgi:hypothetical protein